MHILHLKPKITKVTDRRLELGLLTAETLLAAVPSTSTLVWSTSTKKAHPDNLIVNPHFKEI